MRNPCKLSLCPLCAFSKNTRKQQHTKKKEKKKKINEKKRTKGTPSNGKVSESAEQQFDFLAINNHIKTQIFQMYANSTNEIPQNVNKSYPNGSLLAGALTHALCCLVFLFLFLFCFDIFFLIYKQKKKIIKMCFFVFIDNQFFFACFQNNISTHTK